MFGPLVENFRLLNAEVEKQVRDTARCLQVEDPARIEKIHLRDDYIDNMKGIIQGRVFRLMHEHPEMTKPQVDTLRAIGIATDNLENIADFCTHIADQTHFLSSREFLLPFELPRFFEEILPAMSIMEPAILEKKAGLAFRICRAEFRLDALYKCHFDEIMRRLEGHGEVADLITSLFIIRYLERAGDALLNIGEAALSCILGQKFKIHQVSALDHAAEQLAMDNSLVPPENGPGKEDGAGLEQLEYHTMAETRSGCRIGRIRNPARRGAGNWTLYKEGAVSKLALEKQNLERWNELIPGLVPGVVGYHEQDGYAHLLLEYLQGQTFQEILLTEPDGQVMAVTDAVLALLASLWAQTMEPVAVPSGFMKQLQGRLPDILRLHPAFDTPAHGIGTLVIPPFSHRISQLAELETGLEAPFSVFIHGDFNNDNLIVEPAQRQVRFIDVNRSRPGDYLQDVTVFLLSNFRLPVFEPTVRKRITRVNGKIYGFARAFALAQGDDSFELRCGLGLVRSFLTSTRFVASEAFASNLYHRAMYLVNRLVNHLENRQSFHFPEEILE